MKHYNSFTIKPVFPVVSKASPPSFIIPIRSFHRFHYLSINHYPSQSANFTTPILSPSKCITCHHSLHHPSYYSVVGPSPPLPFIISTTPSPSFQYPDHYPFNYPITSPSPAPPFNTSITIIALVILSCSLLHHHSLSLSFIPPFTIFHLILLPHHPHYLPLPV